MNRTSLAQPNLHRLSYIVAVADDDGQLVYIPIQGRLPKTEVVLANVRQAITTQIMDAFSSECEKLIGKNRFLEQFLITS